MAALQLAILLFSGLTFIHSQVQHPWCVNPDCSTAADRNTLWPLEDANFFLRCDGNWDLLKTPCFDKQLFHFRLQRCVLPADWEPACPEELPECPEVVCQSPADQRVLWPVAMLTRYFVRCMPGPTGGMVPTMVPCEGDTLFSWTRQGCVSADNWVKSCEFPGDTTDDGSTTTEVVTTTTEEVTTTTEEQTTTTEATTTTDAGTTPTPERGICPVPVCAVMDPTHYPHSDWTMYYQCIPHATGYWFPLERDCAAGTVFHFGMQQCVFPVEWQDFCL
ncbi:conserved hypothetical protein [Culex quinquefasciatus]|uniref:Chitin-binding type-2 domain-containing protein n=1 Tax=Culex quinquefasciatus TaxID=7176 RepID=B0WN62_CULQU|nr:conserved hypothetical protein [Culex quinquefasciatus]|eukprot:XP_001850146.1 conserved hypothetical protein [Culex quinquefasciatus]